MIPILWQNFISILFQKDELNKFLLGEKHGVTMAKEAIYKYTVYGNSQPNGFFETEVKMPADAKILSARSSDALGLIDIWAIVNPDAPIVTRVIGSVGTGFAKVDNLSAYRDRFIDTVVDGPYVWHLFDVETR